MLFALMLKMMISMDRNILRSIMIGNLPSQQRAVGPKGNNLRKALRDHKERSEQKG